MKRRELRWLYLFLMHLIISSVLYSASSPINNFNIVNRLVFSIKPAASVRVSSIPYCNRQTFCNNVLKRDSLLDLHYSMLPIILFLNYRLFIFVASNCGSFWGRLKAKLCGFRWFHSLWSAFYFQTVKFLLFRCGREREQKIVQSYLEMFTWMNAST